MKQLWFTTTSFAPTPGEEEQTNPDRYGEALAGWVRGRLVDAGFDSTESPIPEDWGWMIMVQRKPFPLWVGCGNETGSRSRWGLFVEAGLGPIQKLLKRVDVDATIGALERVLENSARQAGFEHIEWEQM